MASKLFIACFLLPAVYARIQINITASSNEEELDVNVSGTNVDIISDVERTTFNINDERLKEAVLTNFGRRADSAYLRSPTPWGDLYQSYNWDEVTRTLSPQRATILSVCTQQLRIAIQNFNNNSSKSAEFRAMVAQEVESSISSDWETNGELRNNQVINHEFDIKSSSISGSNNLNYYSKWGDRVIKLKTASSESGVKIFLEPNQSVIAELYVTWSNMKVKVDYEASLSGDVTVNYADRYKGHHFWWLDVDKVMKSGGLNNSVLSSEVIETSYFTDSRVFIMDASSNVVLYSIPVSLKYNYKTTFTLRV